MIKQYKMMDFTWQNHHEDTAEPELWENLAINFFAKVLDVASDGMQDFVDIEFQSFFIDPVDKEKTELDIESNIKEFERALKGSYKIRG